MQTLALDTYPIHIGPVAESLSRTLQQQAFSQLFVLADENTKAHCWPLIAPVVQPYNPVVIEINSGEAHKNLRTCEYIWQQLMEHRAGRDALLLNLGGGVIGDMGGFAASTFKRGIPFVQIPTTLLAQVDASIGGKLGVDFMQVKNSIGLFCNPQAVLADPAFLSTLSDRELRSGYAEVIKHSLIADAAQWGQLQSLTNLRQADWAQIIPASLNIKKQIVETDPFEKGLRKALNFGHTIGHAIEGHALETDAPLLHGEAIAIGMVCEAFLSCRQQNLPKAQLEQIADYLTQVYSKVALDPAHYPVYLRLMGNDKKNEGQAINFSLLPEAGTVAVNQTADAGPITEALDFYNRL
ncbi:MAG: 3-dehydroquinate synthase [Phaeodactylibacter sp.]|uniref:3-dehydroquinate synthase n=1 Tax=Phaeodactylibacter sp. TaxID=1940289 RepID=UPI0032EB5B89